MGFKYDFITFIYEVILYILFYFTAKMDLRYKFPMVYI